MFDGVRREVPFFLCVFAPLLAQNRPHAKPQSRKVTNPISNQEVTVEADVTR